MSEPPESQGLSKAFLRRLKVPKERIQKYYIILDRLRASYHPDGPLAPAPREYYAKGPDGAPIFVQEWIPRKPEAIVLGQHGNSIQSDLFYALADHLYPREIGIITTDNRGHGRSGWVRGRLEDPELMYPVYDGLIKDVRTRFPGIPIHLYGESLGCTLVAGYLANGSREARQITTVIFQVPPYWLRVQKFLEILEKPLRVLLRLGQIISCNRPWLHMKPDPALSYSHQFRQLDFVDPIRAPKTAAKHLLTAGNLIFKFKTSLSGIHCPAFLLEGTDDRILDPRGTFEMAKHLKQVYRKVKIYPGADHALFHDRHSRAVYDDVLAWLQQPW